MTPDTYYQEQLPDAALADFVRRSWLYRNESGDEQQLIILPDGFFDLVIWIVGGVPQKPLLVGIYTEPLPVCVPSGTAIFGITCKPPAAEYIFKQKIAAIFNHFDEAADELWEMDDARQPFEEMCAACFQKFYARLSHGDPPDDRKLALFRFLAERQGSVTMQELAGQLCLSYRQLARYFADTFGLSAKAYANVLRCAAAYGHIRNGAPGAAFSFYDQSHFIREIRKHTGQRPKDLHRNENGRFLQFSTPGAE